MTALKERSMLWALLSWSADEYHVITMTETSLLFFICPRSGAVLLRMVSTRNDWNYA